MNRTAIAHQVSLTLGDHTEDYDIDAIVTDLGEAGVKSSVDDVDSDTYWAIVERHDTTARPTGFTAWLTTQKNMLATYGPYEVNVTEDEASGESQPMGDTALNVPEDDDEAAQRAAENVLSAAGWVTEGDWEQYDHGYTIAVRRTA